MLQTMFSKSFHFASTNLLSYWVLSFAVSAFNSNLICSSLSDVNFVLVIPFFLARWYGFSVNNTIYHDCWLLIIQLKLQIMSGWLSKTRSMVLLRLPCCLVGSFMNCTRLYSWVSSIDFFEGKERLAEALRLSHEIFRTLKLPMTITSCLWILSPNLSREAPSLSRLFTLWRVKSDLRVPSCSLALAPDDFTVSVQVNTMRSYDTTFYCLENTATMLSVKPVLS